MQPAALWPPCCLAIASVLMSTAGCRQTPAPASQPAAADPRGVIQALIDARADGRYADMTPLILPGRAGEVTSTLLAVDSFLQANAALCTHVRSQVGLGFAGGIDQSQLARHLGIFSEYVTLVDATISGDDADVSYMVDEALPLRHAALRRIDGQWRYDPGPGYDPAIAEAFQTMAKGLRRVLDDLQRGQLSADDIRANPERLREEVRLRLLPGVQKLPRP